MAKKGIMERLKEGVVLGDGGYIVELEQRGHVVTGAFTPEVVIRHPQAISELHYEMKNAGCEVLQVMAFYGSREKLATVGYGDKTFEINQKATQLARDVAGTDLLVAGDLSTTWKWKKGDKAAIKEVTAMFDEQLEAQKGVDFWIGELFFDLGEALLCAERIKAKTKQPAMITMSIRGGTKTVDGYTAAECATQLKAAGVEIIGLNCMNDPEHMYPHIKAMRDAIDGYIAAQPVAYRCTDDTPWFTGQPAFPDKLETIQMDRYALGEFASKAKEMGVNYIGGCCGCKATHMREMAKALGKYKSDRVWNKQASAMSETEYSGKHRAEVEAKRKSAKK